MLLEEEQKKEPKEFKKKKPKRKVYYGIKTRRMFLRDGYGSNEKITLFHYVKNPEEPSIYAQDVFWYDLQRQKIVKKQRIKSDEVERYRLLHGPYKETVGGNTTVNGVFYLGTKHARWEVYAKAKDVQFKKKDPDYQDSIYVEQDLLKKEKYYHGWPKDSEITFYDPKKEKIKEVIPIVNGEKHGTYLYFFENGKVKEEGEYVHGMKAGRWTEYYHGKRSHFRKKITMYPKDPLKETFEPYVQMEWDENGKVIYDKEVEDKKKKKKK